MAKAEERRETDSGIEVKPVYTREDADVKLELLPARSGSLAQACEKPHRHLHGR